jgi:hypothetical protein
MTLTAAVWTLFGGNSRTPFTALEQRLLQELEQRLGDDAGRLLAEQIKRITSIHRLDRDVWCYPTTRGQVYHDPAIDFVNKPDELKLATIHFHLPPLEGRWKADFWAVRGHFFNIVFQPKVPRRRPHEAVVIDKVKIHADPMERVAEVNTPAEPADPQQFSGWLRGWAEQYPVSNAVRPLSVEQREKKLQQLSTKLPEDYLELVSQCEEIVVNGCAILGLSEVYVVHPGDGDYLVLADCRGEGCLAARSGSRDGTVYYFPYDGSGPINTGSSFREAIEKRCSDETGRAPKGAAK